MRARILAAALILLAGFAVPVFGTPAQAAPTLPAGFRLIDYPTGLGPFNLTNFAFTPDGGLLAIGKDGRVNFTPPGGGPAELARLPEIRTAGDFGLLGLSLANDYQASGRVFLLYAELAADGSGNGHAVLSEWTASPPLQPTRFTLERTIIDGARTSPAWSQNSLSHGVSTVLQADDGSIYFGSGDDASFTAVDANALRALDLDDPHGKIFRIRPDGQGHPANPFYDPAAPSSWRSRVFAYGFRNPFRFTLDPRTGSIMLGDVGWRDHEEVDVVTPGRSYGWPCYEGALPQPGYAALAACQSLYAQAAQPAGPIWTYSHSGRTASVVGGAFYGGSTYPPEYHGAFFFGDYSRATLWTLQTDSSGGLVRAPEPAGFGTGLGGPVALQSGPNGDIAYADIIGGAVRRLVYAPGNRPPTAVISTIVNPATRTVSFSAAQSYDLDGDQLAASWDFGDGTTSSAVDPTHAYADGGPYVVRLTVTDALGAAASSTATVSPDNHTPTLVLDAPDQRYEVGAPVKVAVRASDDEDGDLTANVSWQVTLRHCSPDGSCHLHPGSSSTGPAFNAAFTDHGSDTTMVITAAVSDSVGAITQATYEARPDLHTLTVSAPVPVRVNGEQLISVRAVTGSTNSVAAPVAHSYWEFVGWSDGGGPTREVTMPAGDLALVAAYRTAIAARYAAIGGSSSRLGNASSLEFDVPGGRARDYQRSRMYWSPTTGARFVLGGIYVRYTRTGAHAAWGFPTTDEFAIAGGAASYFQRANIYWTQATGAHEVHGSIRKKYLALGGPAGYGFPVTDEVRAADGIGRYSDFAGNRSVYWTTATGAHEIRGSIKTAWLRLGAGRSRLRYPTSDEIRTSYGAVSRFQGGRIEWHRSTNSTKTFYSQ